MFYDKFASLCRERGVKPTKAAAELGVDSGTVSRWKSKGYTPRAETLKRIASNFNVDVSFFLNDDDSKVGQVLSEKEQRDIAKEVVKIMSDLGESGDLMFDGVPMSDDARTAMSAAMQTMLEIARTLNKKTYTPPKFRNEEE